MADATFDTIESAHDFVRLLWQEVKCAEAEILDDIARAGTAGAARHLDALRLVHYKLRQLDDHLTASSRLLNDLRVLRRLLTGDAGEPRRDPASATLEVGPPRLSAV
jgi:hypothetical protein